MNKEELASIFDMPVDKISSYRNYALLFVAFPILTFVRRYYCAATSKADGIRVGQKQIPEIWNIYTNLAEKMGMKTLPKLYVVSGEGEVNAFALSCNTNVKYIVLHSEIAMLFKTHPEIVEFVLGHELGHHKLRYTSLWRSMVSSPLELIPGFGSSFTHAQEYSADRMA